MAASRLILDEIHASAPLGADLAAFGRAVAALGTRGFYPALMQAARAALPGRPVQVVHYSPYVAPRYVCTLDTPVEEQEMYASRFYRLDPLYVRMFAGAPPRFVHLAATRPGRARAGEYFSVFLARTGMADEVGMLFPTVGGGVVGLFLQSPVPFTTLELALIERLDTLCRPLSAAHDRFVIAAARSGAQDGDPHHAFVLLDGENRETFRSRSLQRLAEQEPGFEEAIRTLAQQPGGVVRRLPGGLLHVHDMGEELASLPGGRICFYEPGPQAQAPLSLQDEVDLFINYYRLTARQTQILRMVMRGYPSSGIAKTLGLSEGTVRNHRKEIYAKIDVTTEREIFAAFFAFLATR